VIQDCWNLIGVHGTASCPELVAHVHCRNCPTHASAAAQLLDIEIPAGYARHWTELVAQEQPLFAPATKSIVIFRVDEERLALSTDILREIVDMRPIRTLPHQSNDAALGLVAVRGELLICISLGCLLGLPGRADSVADTTTRPRVPAAHDAGSAVWRLLVVERDSSCFVVPVHEIYGVERYREGDLLPTPATVELAQPTYTKAVLPWGRHSVSLLDDELLFSALTRRLTSTAT